MVTVNEPGNPIGKVALFALIIEGLSLMFKVRDLEMVTGLPRDFNVMSKRYRPPLPGTGIPVMCAGFLPLNDKPPGSVPIRPIFPSLAEMAKEPCDPTVNVA